MPINHLLRTRDVSMPLTKQHKHLRGGMHLHRSKVDRTIDPVRAGDVLTLRIPEDAETLEPIDFALDIVYEDGDVLVINKPPTLPMHPSHNHQGDTLANAVAAHLAGQGKRAAFRAAGRLDKGTSGLVVCCLHSYAASKLNGQVKKVYFALVHGEYRGSGTFTNAIYRPFAHRTLRACRDYEEPREPGDETAITHWEALAYRDGVSYLRIWLETGRTHQIRVHFGHHGTPLLGDDYYGAPPREESGHFLHCGEARFVHPVNGKEMAFIAEMPEHMRKIAEII